MPTESFLVGEREMQKQEKSGKLRDTQNKPECLPVSWILAVAHPELCWRGAPRAQEELADVHRLTRAEAGAGSLAAASRSACIHPSVPAHVHFAARLARSLLLGVAGLWSEQCPVEDGQLCFVFRFSCTRS